MQIGDTVWFFDGNRRVYRDGSSGPVYREHWFPAKIVGETSRSWITDNWNRKIPKKGLPGHGVALTAEDVEKDVWMNTHAYRVYEQIQRCRDYDTIRKIADLIGYKP